jgi:hypothetical protein
VPTRDSTKRCFEKITFNNETVINTCVRSPQYTYVGQISPVDMCIAFSALSAGFQLIPILAYLFTTATAGPNARTEFQKMTERGLGPTRFIEYSISATIMVLIVALLNGVTDVWILLFLGVANWSTMIFGLLHEYIFAMWRLNKKVCKDLEDNLQENNRLVVKDLEYIYDLAPISCDAWLAPFIAHVAGLAPFGCVWACIIGMFTQSVDSMDGVPNAVRAIPWFQFAVFLLFSFNQFIGSVCYEPDETRMFWFKSWSYYYTEYAYMFLSLIAKMVLIWLIFAGTLMQGSTNLVASSMC